MFHDLSQPSKTSRALIRVYDATGKVLETHGLRTAGQTVMGNPVNSKRTS